MTSKPYRITNRFESEGWLYVSLSLGGVYWTGNAMFSTVRVNLITKIPAKNFERFLFWNLFLHIQRRTKLKNPFRNFI